MIIDASCGSPNIKPPMWAIDPGIVAQNASKTGLPMFKSGSPFWERSGKKICDLSGNEKNYTISTAATWVTDYVSCNVDHANISVFSDCETELPKQGSFACGIKLLGSKIAGNFILHSSSYLHFSFYWRGASNDYRFYCANDLTDMSHTIDPLDGNYHNLVITWDAINNKRRMYVDGQLAGSSNDVMDDANWSDLASDFLSIGGIGVEESQCAIYYSYLFDFVLTYPSQVATISANPYGLARQPSMEELWAYAVAVGGVAPTGVFYGPLYGPLGGPA